MPRFLFVVTGHRVGPFIEPLVESLDGQTCTDWKAIFVDDASPDGSAEAARRAIAKRGLGDRFALIVHDRRRYKARNVFEALATGRHDGSEVVVMLDGDDRLSGPRALEVLGREYDRGFDVVWSNWVGCDGSKGKSAPLSPLLSPRRQPFVTQHLFSFRRRLFDAVRASDLQDDEGRWFRAGCDAALAWPLLEQTRRWRFVDLPLCVYNRSNPQGHKVRGNKREQIRTLAILRERREPRPPFRSGGDVVFAARHAHHQVGAALMNAALLGRYRRHRRRIREYRAGRGVID
jgi:glycosyltransferase involved in cell wall biosynthesis